VRGVRYVYASKLKIPEKKKKKKKKEEKRARRKNGVKNKKRGRMVKHPSKRATRVA